MNKTKEYLIKVMKHDIMILSTARDKAFDEYHDYVATHNINGTCMDLKQKYIDSKTALENAELLKAYVENSIILDDVKLVNAIKETAKKYHVSPEEMIFIILYDYLEVE